MFGTAKLVLSFSALVLGAPKKLAPGIDVHNVDTAWDEHVATVGIHARELSEEGTPILLPPSDPVWVHDSDLQAYRKSIFKDRFKRFTQHNERFEKGLVTYRQVINQFSDLSLDELKTFIGGKGFVGKPVDAEVPEGAEVVLPKVDPKADYGEIDWRSDDLPVHNQGNCGSCWAFASASMIENRLYHAGYGFVPVAQQEMVDCVDECWGCSGGWSFYATDYVAKNGIASNNDYAYKGYDQQCAANKYDRVVKAGELKAQYARAKGEEYLPSILSTGPVTIAFWVNEDFFYVTGDDIYSPQSKCNMYWSIGGHAVTLVGMQDDHWILQNSWGTTWGDSGYFRMARGENACKIGTIDNWSWISLSGQETFPEVDDLLEEALALDEDVEDAEFDSENVDKKEEEQPGEGDNDDGLSPGLIVLIVASVIAGLILLVVPAGIWWSNRFSGRKFSERGRKYDQLVKSYGGTSSMVTVGPTKSGVDPSNPTARLEYYKEPAGALEMKRTNLSSEV